MAKSWNLRMFKQDPPRSRCGVCSIWPKSAAPARTPRERGMMARFSHKLAIAPTASISIICGGT